jgi:Arc/MetJ-type ribon-helix-helix transcriptional regulator
MYHHKTRGIKVADDLIHIRIDPEIKKEIEKLVKAGRVDSISSFVNDAIRSRLDPNWNAQETKTNITFLIENDEDFREKLKGILN